MKLGSLNASWRLASLSNKVLLVTVAVQAVLNVMMFGAASANKERVVVAPPTLDQPYTIGWRSATPEYYKSMALYFTGLLGSIGPKNVDYVVKTLERFSAPEIADAFRKRMRALSADYNFKESNSATWFEGERLLWEEKSGKVFVVGMLRSADAARGRLESKPAVFEWKLEIHEGQPVITGFDSYEGNAPHTLAWLQDPKKAEADVKRHARDGARADMTEATLDEQAANDQALRDKAGAAWSGRTAQ